jgi:hypothetical protein
MTAPGPSQPGAAAPGPAAARIRAVYSELFGSVPASIETRLALAQQTGRLEAVEAIEALRRDIELGCGLPVVDVIPAEHLEGDLIQAVGEVGDLRGGGVLDQGPGFHVRGQPGEGRLDRPGRAERRVGRLLGQQVLEDFHERVHRDLLHADHRGPGGVASR